VNNTTGYVKSSSTGRSMKPTNNTKISSYQQIKANGNTTYPDGIVKESHIGWDMTWTNIYKQRQSSPYKPIF